MTIFTPHPLIQTDSVFIRDLPLSQLRLQNQSLVPWLILVPRRAEVTEITQLPAHDRHQLMDEITLTSKAIQKLYPIDKINVGALGNVVAQLHVHIIGRYHTDAAWPAPVWGRLEAAPYADAVLKDTIQRLNDDALWR